MLQYSRTLIKDSKEDKCRRRREEDKIAERMVEKVISNCANFYLSKIVYNT